MADNLRKTAQRDAILYAIQHAEGPMTVNQILKEVQKKIPKLGIATVYRTIKHLLKQKSIKVVSLPNDVVRYETNDLGHHHHFSCVKCEKVFDMPGCMLPKINGTEIYNGYLILNHEITLFGECPSCRGI